MTSFNTMSGTDTHIILEFPNSMFSGSPYLYMGSVITLSYSVYRQKTPVFNCGNPLVAGFAIGNKYVAGTFITTVTHGDEVSDYLNKISEADSDRVVLEEMYRTQSSGKDNHSLMRDDMSSFNIHVLFTSEYEGVISRIIIYGATFMNNGQQMSINDLITESETSYVARDISEMHTLKFSSKSVEAYSERSVSDLMARKGRV